MNVSRESKAENVHNEVSPFSRIMFRSYLGIRNLTISRLIRKE